MKMIMKNEYSCTKTQGQTVATPLTHAGSSLRLSGGGVWSWSVHFTSYAASGDLTVWGHERGFYVSGRVRILPVCFL